MPTLFITGIIRTADNRRTGPGSASHRAHHRTAPFYRASHPGVRHRASPLAIWAPGHQACVRRRADTWASGRRHLWGRAFRAHATGPGHRASPAGPGGRAPGRRASSGHRHRAHRASGGTGHRLWPGIIPLCSAASGLGLWRQHHLAPAWRHRASAFTGASSRLACLGPFTGRRLPLAPGCRAPGSAFTALARSSAGIRHLASAPAGPSHLAIRHRASGSRSPGLGIAPFNIVRRPFYHPDRSFCRIQVFASQFIRAPPGRAMRSVCINNNIIN